MIKQYKYQLMTILLAIGLTVLLTWPLTANISSYYTDNGDYPFNGAILWYHQHALLSGKIFKQKEYFNGYQAYPRPYTLAYSNLSLIPSFIFAPIYWLTRNYSFSVNLFGLLTFFLSFLASFYVIYKFTQDRLASILGAFVFAFNPITFSRFPDHLDLLNKYFLPLVFYFAYRFFNRPSFKSAFLFFLFYTLNALSVNYYFIISTIVLAFVAILFVLYALFKKNLGYIISIFKYGLVGLIFLPFLIYFLLPYYIFSKQEGAYRPLSDSQYFSATIFDWFSSTRNNLISGPMVKSLEKIRNPKNAAGIFNNYQEGSLFLNIIPMLLFGVFCYHILSGGIRGRASRQRADLSKFTDSRALAGGKRMTESDKIVYIYYLLALFLTFIFTFGPYFLGWNGDGEGIKLPYYYLYQYVPLFQGIRVPARFQLVFYAPFSLFVGLGALYIFQKFKKRKILLFILFLLLLTLENINMFNFSEKSKILVKVKSLKKTQNLRFLENKAVLHIPIYMPESFGEESTYLNWLTQTKEKIVNSNSGFIPPDQLFLLKEIKQNLDEGALKKLASIGVNFLIIHTDSFNKQDKQLYNKFIPFYLKGAVLNQDQTIIVDLSRFNFQIKYCVFPDDFAAKFATGRLANSDKFFTVAVFKNTKDCYLASLYEKRYRRLPNVFNNDKKWVEIRLPPVVGPFEQFEVSEINRNLKFE